MRIPRLLHLGACLAATAAAAAEETGPSPLPQVIVSARGYAEPADAVPISMTSLDTGDLDRLEIHDFDALAAAAPGLAYTFGRATGGVPVMRGMSQTDTSTLELENNVATVFDGVYVANAFAVDPTMADLERVDVLRGPQNATLGRNAFAGAVMYSPQRPTSTWQGAARVGAGSNQFREGMAAIGGPLSPSLGLRLSARAESFDGTITNQAEPSQLLGGWSKQAASGMLVWKGAENSGTAELAGYYFKRRRDATARFPIGYADAPFNCGADPASATPDVNYCGVVPGRSSVDISPIARGLTTDTWIGKLQLEIPLGDLQLTSVTAYVTTYNDTPPDEWDLSSTGQLLPVVKINAPDVVVRYQHANEYFSGFPTNDREWSQELRLASRQTRVRWMLGAAYSTNSSSYYAASSTDSSGLAADEMFPGGDFVDQTRTPLNLIPAFEGRGTDRITAAFGSLGASFGRFELQGELRYSRDRWHGETLLTFYTPANEPPQNGQWEFWTPRVTIEYHKSADELLYVSAAKGVRSGGFNDPYPPNVPSEAQFQAEENWTYEAGMKSRLAAGRVQLTAAVYYTDWSNMQMQGLSSDPGFPYPVTHNLDGSIVRGAELAVEAHPAAWLDLSLAYAYADARFRGGVIDLGVLSNCSPTICNMVPGTATNPLVPDVGGNHLPGAPRNALALRATLHGRWAGDRQWFVRTGFDVTDRQFIASDNVNWTGARQLLSAGAGITVQAFELSLWGRNLLDQHYVTRAGYSSTFSLTGPPYSIVFGDPANGRQFGGSVTYHFAAGGR
jgi:iron complex outermembrane receptor protein